MDRGQQVCPLGSCTAWAKGMLDEVGPKAPQFIFQFIFENRSCHGQKALHRDPIRLYLLASNPR